MRETLQRQCWREPHARLAGLFALISLLVTLASCAHAQLNVQLDAATQTGKPSKSVTFSGLLQNTGASDLYLNGFDFDFGSADLFFIGDIAPSVPLGLSSSSSPGGIFPSGSYTGDIFVVHIDPATPKGIYSVGVTISGGADEQASNPLANIFFQVEVSELPEPGALALFALGVAAFAVRRRRA